MSYSSYIAYFTCSPYFFRLNHFKARTEQLQQSVNQSDKTMAGALEDKSAMLKKQEKLKGEARTLEKQVAFHAERNKSDAERSRS